MDTPPPVRPTASVLRSAVGTLAVLALGFAAAYAVSEARAPMYTEVRARDAVLGTVAPEIEAAVFGPSHSYAIRFQDLGVRGFYFGLSAADLFECRRLLQYALPRLPNLREVYLAVAPYQNDNGDFPQRYGRRRSVYAQTGTLRPISGDWRLALTTPLMPVIRDDHWLGVFEGQQSPVVLHNGIVVGGTKGGEGDGWDKVPTDSMEAEGRRSAKRLSEGIGQLLRADPTLCERTDEALRAFVDDAGPDLRVILFTPPYHPSFLSQPRPCDPLRTARALADERPNVVYFDYSRSEISEQANLFSNPDHLNLQGRALFTAQLRRALAEPGVFESESSARGAY